MKKRMTMQRLKDWNDAKRKSKKLSRRKQQKKRKVKNSILKEQEGDEKQR